LDSKSLQDIGIIDKSDIRIILKLNQENQANDDETIKDQLRDQVSSIYISYVKSETKFEAIEIQNAAIVRNPQIEPGLRKILKSDVFIVLTSPLYLQSPYAFSELIVAYKNHYSILLVNVIRPGYFLDTAAIGQDYHQHGDSFVDHL
jgi:hypothetical protein